MHGFRRVAASLGRERPESRACLVDTAREVPAAGLPVVGLVAVAHDADANALGHAAEEVDEVVDAALRVSQFARHARGAIDEDREVHRTIGDARQVALEGDETLGFEVGHLVARDLAHALRGGGYQCGGFVAWSRLALAVPLAPAVVPPGVVAGGDGREPRRQDSALRPVHAEHDARKQVVHALADGLVVGAVERGEALERQHGIEGTAWLLETADARVDRRQGHRVTRPEDGAQDAGVRLRREPLGRNGHAAAREARVGVGAHAPRRIL